MGYIGLIPAAGRATRLGIRSGSKELLPVGPLDSGSDRPSPVIDHLLAAFGDCKVDGVYVVIRDGKWDIPSYLADGARYGFPIAYLMMGLPFGPSYTLDQAHRFVAQRSVLLGFPDIVFHPQNAFQRLTARLERDTKVDVVLGLFPTDSPWKMDMVRCDGAGRVTALEIKPPGSELRYAWIIAAWRPRFTDFLHEHLAAHRQRYEQPGSREAQIGTVFQAAIEAGVEVVAECFSDGWVIDIGTPDDLERARTRV